MARDFGMLLLFVFAEAHVVLTQKTNMGIQANEDRGWRIHKRESAMAVCGRAKAFPLPIAHFAHIDMHKLRFRVVAHPASSEADGYPPER
jgi:hypothetical protein